MKFKIGQIFRTKNDRKMEVTNVFKGGSVELKLYVHRDSKNCKSYGWSHNTKSFRQCMSIEGNFGLLKKIEKEGWELEKKVVATVTKD